MEVRGSENNQRKVKNPQNPHPTLTLGKGEASQAPLQSKEALNVGRK